MDFVRVDLYVSWRGGVWFIGRADDPEPFNGDGAALDQRLAERGLGRADLDFLGSHSLKQKFIHDFGPINPA
jgi:hypothetical protein